MFWKKKEVSTLERDIEVFNKFVKDLTEEEVEFSRADAKREAKKLLKELYPEHYPSDFEYWEDELDCFSADYYKEEFNSGAECFLYNMKDLMMSCQEDDDNRSEFYKRIINLDKIFNN